MSDAFCRSWTWLEADKCRPHSASVEPDFEGAAVECIDPEGMLYHVTLVEPGRDRLAVMKLIRHYRPDLPPIAAKRLIESTPCPLLSNVNILLIRTVVRAFWDAGATVALAGPLAEDPGTLERIMWPGGVISRQGG
jgi:ribosomal protein L7/L12